MLKISINQLILVLVLGLFFTWSCKNRIELNEPDESVGTEQQKAITINGIIRNYTIYLPKRYESQKNLPLVLALHGGGGSPESMRDLTNLNTIADQENFILVYPKGIQNSWNDGRPTASNKIGIDDISFVRQLIGSLTKAYKINSNKIYATGISNGGFMASRLACELSETFAAVAVVAASIEAKVANDCVPKLPIATLYIQGTADNIIPINGGTITAIGASGGDILSHEKAVNKWVQINQCNPKPLIKELPDLAADGTTIQQKTFTSAENNKSVESYLIKNGGHTWPKGKQNVSETIVGITSQNLNASETIWQFFKKHSK